MSQCPQQREAPCEWLRSSLRSLCEIRLLGTLCAFGTAQPFPLLLTGRWAPLPGWGCAFLRQAAGRAPGQGDRKAHTALAQDLCRDEHLC